MAASWRIRYPARVPAWLHPWLRITLVLRTVLHTHRDAETWPVAKKELRTAIALKAQLARAAWWS
jgi:hypothetical protein